MAAGDATKYALRVRRAHSSSSNLARILRIPTGRVLTKGLPLGLQMSGSEGKSAPKSGFCRSGLHFQPIHTGRSRKGTPPIIYPVVYTVVVARGACRRSRRRVSSFAAAPFGSAAYTLLPRDKGTVGVYPFYREMSRHSRWVVAVSGRLR